MARLMSWHDMGLTLAPSSSGFLTDAISSMLAKFINTHLGINNAHCYSVKKGGEKSYN